MLALGRKLLIFAVMVMLFCLAPASLGAGKSGKLDGFAHCLAEKKATMYGAFWCDHCREQKELFGDSARYLPYVECVEKGTRKVTEQCKALGIRRTPTWIFENGDRVDGKVLSLDELSRETGCRLP